VTTRFGTLIGASWAVLVAACLGCVPMRVWEVPAVSGRVHRGARPLSGATVTWLNLDSANAASTAQPAGSGVTNDQGEFAIPAKRKWGTGALLPADAVVKWRVELGFNGHTTVLWEQRLVVPGRHSTPWRVRIDCDLSEVEPCLLVDSDQPRLHPTGRRLPRARADAKVPPNNALHLTGQRAGGDGALPAGERQR
jgi:acetyl esterase/lipase